MFKNILIFIFSLGFLVGCGLMGKSKSDSITALPESSTIVNGEDNKSGGEAVAFPASADNGVYQISDIDILAQEIIFIPKLFDEIDREPNIFIRENNITKLNKKYSFDNYTLLSGDIKYESDGSMILNMRLLDNRYSITKEYLNYRFNFSVNGDEKSLYPISGQETINNHTFLAINDNNQNAMKFDLMNNLLNGGLFRYFNQNKNQVVFESIGINEMKIFVDKNSDNIFEDEEITYIILGEL